MKTSIDGKIKGTTNLEFFFIMLFIIISIFLGVYMQHILFNPLAFKIP